jgi:hypothetical protein
MYVTRLIRNRYLNGVIEEIEKGRYLLHYVHVYLVCPNVEQYLESLLLISLWLF